MANYSIEIERNNVTLAQFLRYVRQQCAKKGIYMEIDRDEFEKPSCPESYSYTVINGEKNAIPPVIERLQISAANLLAIKP